MTQKANTQWQGSIAISAILHTILIALFLFGMPSVFQKLPEEKEALTFDILPLSAITNVKNETKSEPQKKPVEKNKEVKKIPPKEKPKPVVKTTAEQKKQIDKKPPAPVVKKEIKPIKEQKTVRDIKKKPEVIEKKKESEIDSILKNLEKESEKNDKKTNSKNNNNTNNYKNSTGAIYDENSPLSITEKLLVKNQIQKQWRPPVGAHNLEDVRIVVHIKIEKNGTITEAVIKETFCPPNSETTCKLAADSAIRAISKASPLENLPLERYDIWKEFNLLFDPSFLSQ